MALVLVLAGLAGVAAAALPARRAVRPEVLEAIATAQLRAPAAGAGTTPRLRTGAVTVGAAAGRVNQSRVARSVR
jgi:hypothetical protein